MQVLRVAEHAAQVVASGRAAWAAVSLWGWEDSPLAWQGMQRSTAHTLGLPGDASSQALLLFMRGGDVLVMRALGASEIG
jgi:hypothetical protein